MTIRVLVVDDQAMVRAGFRLLLGDEPDIEVVAEASNGLEAVSEAARVNPHVVLMDIRMPELDGLEATRRILAADPTSRILILTTFDLDEYVYRALQAGASGFVLKDDPPEQLIAAVRTVAGGDALLSPSVTRRVIAQFTKVHQQAPPKAVETLTAREMDVFRLITQGLLERRDRRRAVHQRHDGQDACDPAAAEAGPARPRPGDRARVPVGVVRELRGGSRDGRRGSTCSTNEVAVGLATVEATSTTARLDSASTVAARPPRPTRD